jgi:hypothetical protein
MLSIRWIHLDVAILGCVCLGLWCWALSRLINLLGPPETERAPGRWIDVRYSLLALAISPPIAYYLFWLLTTPPAVVSAVGVTREPGPPDYTPTAIRWSDVTAIRCTYPVLRRRPRRNELTVQSGMANVWIGRMTRVRAEELLEKLHAYVPPGVIQACPEWTEFPPLRSTK